jgi:hypothetical protein
MPTTYKRDVWALAVVIVYVLDIDNLGEILKGVRDPWVCREAVISRFQHPQMSRISKMTEADHNKRALASDMLCELGLPLEPQRPGTVLADVAPSSPSITAQLSSRLPAAEAPPCVEKATPSEYPHRRVGQGNRFLQITAQPQNKRQGRWMEKAAANRKCGPQNRPIPAAPGLPSNGRTNPKRPATRQPLSSIVGP